MYKGEPSTGHAEGAVLSVYFRHTEARWINDLSVDSALEAGAYGLAPGAELFRLGPDRDSACVEGGNIGQGYTSTHAHVLTLSDQADRGRRNFAWAGEQWHLLRRSEEAQRFRSPVWAWQASTDSFASPAAITTR